MMDAVFKPANFINEIVWRYSWGNHIQTRWNRKHDIILFYTTGKDWIFNAKDVMEKREGEVLRRLSTGVPSATMAADKSKSKDRTLKLPTDVWNIPTINGMAKERTGYPTQKPIALLNRIIKASSNRGDMVLDPFCGCATTCVSAEIEGRQWVGIDISPKAYDLVKSRLKKEVEIGGMEHAGDHKSMFGYAIHREDIPKRTDLGKLPPYNGQENKRKLYGEQGGDCAGCDTHFEARNLEVDHIIARNKGGTDHIENLQLLCGSCNRIKGNRGMEYLRVKLQL